MPLASRASYAEVWLTALIACGNCFPQRREREAHRFRRNSVGIESDLIAEATDGSRDHDGKVAWVDPQLDSVLVAVPNDHVGGHCPDGTDVLPKTLSVFGLISCSETHLSESALQRAGERFGKPRVHGRENLTVLFRGFDLGGKVAELALALLVADREEQIGLVSEVGIERPPRIASLDNNFFDRRPVVPASGEYVERSLDQSGSSLRLGLRPS